MALDLVTREDTTVEPHSLALVPGNIVVAVPEGHALLVTLRSSTPRRLGLICPHGIGVIDQDYCGTDDEIRIQVYNVRDGSVTVPRGARIAQALLLPTSPIEWDEVGIPAERSRGGFGSTG